MPNYTLTYADSVQGFPSFYSFSPDWMIGMNNYFYTFKGGNLYRHNVNPVRNNFYGIQYTTTMKSVFNKSPLENKLFKTINLEGDTSWGVTLSTDLQNSGFIESPWFEKKESSWYAFVRNSGGNPATLDQYSLRSLNGIGTSSNVSGTALATVIDFSISPLISIGGTLSVGDFFYFVTGASPTVPGTPAYAGKVTAVNIDLPAGINQVIIDTTVPGTTLIPSTTEYFMSLKDSVAESHGVLGHYCLFDMTNNETDKISLFAIESEIMKSYP